MIKSNIHPLQKQTKRGKVMAVVAVAKYGQAHHHKSSKKITKEKLIRVLLDSGSDGDLLFRQKRDTQGTHKFFSLITGKKIKRRQFTRYPVPDSVITKVKRFARAGVAPGALDFANWSGILFEWNKEIDESLSDLVEEDKVPYPTITAKFPGVDLACEVIGPTVEDAVKPHGRTKDTATLNAGILPVNITGVERPAIIDAQPN
jgi:hypothetical protein